MTGGGGEGEMKTVDDSEEPPSSLTLVPGSQDPSRTSDSDRTLAGRASSSPSVASLETAEEYMQPGAITDGPLSSPQEAVEDRISDSLSEEHMESPHGQASPGPSLSLALCLLQSYAVYRPVRSNKGSKLPVLHRQSSRNGGSRLSFPDPVLGLSYGTPYVERDNHMPTPELETPLIRLDVGVDHDLSMADMENYLEDLYKEYPPPPPHQVYNIDESGKEVFHDCRMKPLNAVAHFAASAAATLSKPAQQPLMFDSEACPQNDYSHRFFKLS